MRSAKESDVEDFEQIKRDPISRRAFLMRMSAAGLGVAAAGLLQGCNGGSNGGPGVPIGGGRPTPTPTTGGNTGGTFPGIPGSGDVQVLNFALTLERLEADLYRQALNKAAGKPQNTPLAPIASANAFYGTAPAVGPGTYANLGSGTPTAETRAAVGFLYLKQFTYVEATHRDFLIAAIRSLGGTPVGAARGGYRFNPATNPNNNPGDDIATILATIIPLEETGTRAYLGAVPFVSDGNVLTTAGTIYSTECRHSAAVRYIVDENDVGPSTGALPGITDLSVAPSPTMFNGVRTELFEKYLQPATVIRAVQPMLIS